MNYKVGDWFQDSSCNDIFVIEEIGKDQLGTSVVRVRGKQVYSRGCRSRGTRSVCKNCKLGHQYCRYIDKSYTKISRLKAELLK